MSETKNWVIEWITIEKPGESTWLEWSLSDEWVVVKAQARMDDGRAFRHFEPVKATRLAELGEEAVKQMVSAGIRPPEEPK